MVKKLYPLLGMKIGVIEINLAKYFLIRFFIFPSFARKALANEAEMKLLYSSIESSSFKSELVT